MREKIALALGFAFIASLCFYLDGYSIWWVLGIPVFAVSVLALYALAVASPVVFVLLVFDIFAYLAGVSLWLVLGIPVGVVALGMLVTCVNICREYKRLDRQINERTSLLPSHVPRPSAVTSPRIVSSQSSYISRLPIDTAPRVLRVQSSSSVRTVVNPALPQNNTLTSPSPAVADSKRPLHANTISESSSTMTGRQVGRVANNSTQPVRKTPRPEVDGLPLHASVTAEVDNRYLYDENIKTESARFSATESVVGVFKCYNCHRKKSQPEEPRIWTSCGICVEIWMSTGSRYRTRLHSQICNRCHNYVEPELDKDDYVTKVVRVLDGWTGQHSMVKPLRPFIPAGPHQSDKCHACIKGICHQKPAKPTK